MSEGPPGRLFVWVDRWALSLLPGLDGALAREGALVLRSFERVAHPSMVRGLSGDPQVVVVGGEDGPRLQARLQTATATLSVPVVGVVPPGTAPDARLRGPGVLDLVPAGAPEPARRILAVARLPIVTARPGAAPPGPIAAPPPAGAPARHAIGIASSTGGPWLLAELLGALGRSAPPPIFVAQHLDADFVPFFADWLARTTSMPIDVVATRTPIVPGTVYLAAGGHDLCVEPGGATATAERATSAYVPRADRLFAGLAAAFGARASVAVLSGMGGDGAQGAARVMAAGGAVFCQDPATAVVPSMPEQALLACPGASAAPPAALAALLLRRSQEELDDRAAPP